MNKRPLKLFMVAGEASADMHGAALLSELRAHYPNIEAYGVGGERLAAQGMELVVDAHSLNVMGISDWFDKAGEVIGNYRKIKRLIRERRPDVAVLLDLPDFNLLMARKLKALGVPVVYYISPQVWAWRKYRLKTIKRCVDRMLVLFPFEKTFYDANSVDASFVGHPLLESLEARAGYRTQAEIDAGPRVALLPGSRRSEIRFHVPILREVIAKLREKHPTVKFRVPVASTIAFDSVREAFGDAPVELVRGQSREVLSWSDVAIVASGTATLETALIGTPFSLFYKITASSAWIYRNVARYRGFIGMPNLLHREEVAREFFQDKADSTIIAAETLRLIEDRDYRETQADKLRECRAMLGQPGASRRAAAQVADVVKTRAESKGGAFETAASPA